VKKIIISAVVFIGLLWIYCIAVFLLSGCSGAEGDIDNPIVVVGDTAYVNVPVSSTVFLLGGRYGVNLRVAVMYDDYTIEYTNSEADHAKKVVIYFPEYPD